MEQEKDNTKEECQFQDKVQNKVENLINYVLESNEELKTEDIHCLGELVDIHKDIENEKYWKIKEEYYMRYRDYSDYNDYGNEYGRRGVPGTGRGRYRDGESYGRRGVPGSGRGRYRGEDMMDEMYNAYNDYMDSAEYGNYGTSESMQKIEIMADSLIDFIHHIKKEAKTPEEKQLIDEKLREIGRM